MNISEMKGELNMVLARLESEPDSVAEWDTIRRALRKCTDFAADQQGECAAECPDGWKVTS